MPQNIPINECCYPSKHPKKFCAFCCFLSIAISICIFLVAITYKFTSENDKPIPDTNAVLNRETKFFGPTQHVTYSFALNILHYPRTYGAILYVENSEDVVYNSFLVSLNYTLPNTTHSICCGYSYVDTEQSIYISCDIHPEYFPNGTIFVLTLNCAKGDDNQCYASIYFEYLSVFLLSSSTKYSIQTLFDSSYPYPMGITRYHYFIIESSQLNSFTLGLKGKTSYDTTCGNCLSYNRCIYVTTHHNITFVNSETAQYKTCDYSCHYQFKNQLDQSYYLETLQVNIDNIISTFSVSVYIDMNIDSSALFAYGVDLTLYLEEHIWYYPMLLGFGTVFIFCCCMIPAVRYYWKGVGKIKYAQWKLYRKKVEFRKKWKAFHMYRYDAMMQIFGSKDIVNLIQSYMDDLEVCTRFKDSYTFSKWYARKYNFNQVFHVQLEQPLLSLH
eukprot:348145_1